jgi:hypothetical protein
MVGGQRRTRSERSGDQGVEKTLETQSETLVKQLVSRVRIELGRSLLRQELVDDDAKSVLGRLERGAHNL